MFLSRTCMVYVPVAHLYALCSCHALVYSMFLSQSMARAKGTRIKTKSMQQTTQTMRDNVNQKSTRRIDKQSRQLFQYFQDRMIGIQRTRILTSSRYASASSSAAVAAASEASENERHAFWWDMTSESRTRERKHVITPIIRHECKFNTA